MKKIFYGVCFLLGTCALFSSCGDPDAEIDKLISEHKYDEAREVARDNFHDNSMYGYLTQRLTKITEAQLEEIFEDQNYKEIKEVKAELKNPFAYQRMFANYFKKVLNRGNYDFMYSTFEDWEIYNEFHKEYDQWPHNEAYQFEEPKVYDDEFMERIANKRETIDENGPYNAEARFLNDMIDQVLERLIEDKDKDYLKQFIKLYKPYGVLKSKTQLPSNNYSKDHGTYEHHYVCDLENSAKEAALKKIAEANIEL